jgi:tRNA uridine 5-carboxymethylaminomethyl modification enzyme
MFTFPKIYDVIVVGGGHAGIEAALASARLGAETALLTQNLDTIGQMSCNPAIGGLGKGHMVREIDALGGFMGLNTDATGIQFRMLNANKGPSARAPRAQCDKKAYQFRAKHAIEGSPNIDLHQGGVADLTVKNDTICGITTDLGVAYTCKALVLSTGTFMRGLMHVGQESKSGGRMGDGKSTVSDALRRLGFDVARFKTGTPCRLHGKSINYSLLERQNGDSPPPLFSFLADTLFPEPEELFTLNQWGSKTFHVEQVPCWIGYTNDKTHEIIRSNLDKSPMFSGKIEGIGPRYCPSIEDKVVRFAAKDRHQIFLEPEGRHTHECYVNGVSTSLPMEVQYDFIRSIKGLEQAAIIRPGYAVEYDYCPPAQLQSTLETKQIAGLYFAGQINGTSGYEEAAGQGLIAGANAALAVAGLPAFTLEREEAYLGVMIDDLTTKSVLEPYRMFTSRAEFRLLLRQDNADLRLTEKAATHGLIPTERLSRTQQKRTLLEQATTYAGNTSHAGERIARWLKRGSNTVEQLPSEHRARFPAEIWGLLQTEIKYGGYLDRQLAQIERSRKMANRHLPEDMCYHEIKGLKREAQLRLEESRPQNLGQASRLQGVTPADISVLTVYLTRRQQAPQTVTGAEPES